MKENSIEEDIKILEEMIENANIENMDMNDCFGGEHIEAIEHILSDYKRVLKINEVLLKENEELKRKNEELKVLKDDIQDKNIAYIDEPEFDEKYITKQKIKDKIQEEIKYHGKNISDIENITMFGGKTIKEETEIEFNKYAIFILKKILHELIEEKK